MTHAAAELLIRPMTEADLEAAEALSSQAYYDLDLRTHRCDQPEPARRSSQHGVWWRERTAHLLRTDPAGCWVADRDGQVVGLATSLVRERLWVLSSYAVGPGLQGQGIGRQLLAAALHHGRGCLRGMLNASADPRATRAYRRAGFELHPQLMLTGSVPRDALPVVRHVRDGDLGDLDLLDSLDRRVRGAAHGPDHELLTRQLRLVVTDRPAASGYAYVGPTGAPILLAATHRKAARALLWEALAGSDPDVPVRVAHVSAANQWALDVAVTARLAMVPQGFLGLRRMGDPAPYLPHPTFL